MRGAEDLELAVQATLRGEDAVRGDCGLWPIAGALARDREVGQDRGRDAQLSGEGDLEALHDRPDRAARRVADHEADLGHAGRQLELAGEGAPGGALAGRRGDRDRGVLAEGAAGVTNQGEGADLEPGGAAGSDRARVEFRSEEDVDDAAGSRLADVRDRAQRMAISSCAESRARAIAGSAAGPGLGWPGLRAFAEAISEPIV